MSDSEYSVVQTTQICAKKAGRVMRRQMNKREEMLDYIADQKRRFQTVILSHEQADLFLEFLKKDTERATTCRVINRSTGQMLKTFAELDFGMATQLADRLAADDQDRDSRWAVVELVTRYETAPPIK
jgi:hypothetical protein